MTSPAPIVPDDLARLHNEHINRLAWKLGAEHRPVGFLSGQIRCAVDGERMPCAVHRRIEYLPDRSGARFTD